MVNTKEIIDKYRVLVVLPTYNNATTLASVIGQVREYSNNVLVVNDGSTDYTMQIIEQSKVANISYAINKGKGYAIKSAFKYAIECNYNYILTIDSDGQHYTSNIVNFLEKLQEEPDALIIGARNLQADNMPSKNTFANKFSNFWFTVETGKKLDDTQSGYRLYPIHLMKRMKLISNRYEFEVEVIVKAAWRGIKVINIPIKVYYAPVEERISHFKPLKDFTRISILNTFLVFIALLYYYPLLFFRSLTLKNVKQFIRDNVTHTSEPNYRVAASIGLGIFFGIFPIWGYQMIVAAFIAHLLKLNKILTLVSSNISIPPMIPFILYGSFYTGAVILGNSREIDLTTISLERVYSDLIQYLCGSVVLALLAGAAAFLLSYILLLIFRRRVNG